MKLGMIRGICAYQVLRDFGELWSNFSEAQVFNSGYLGHFLCDCDEFSVVGGPAIYIYFPNFVNFGPWVPRHHEATCTSPSLVQLFILLVYFRRYLLST